MKPKHNKKRNTAFLFEALVREMTKAVVRGDDERKKKVLKIVKKHFAKGKPLYEELQIYKSIYETKSADKLISLSHRVFIIILCPIPAHWRPSLNSLAPTLPPKPECY